MKSRYNFLLFVWMLLFAASSFAADSTSVFYSNKAVIDLRNTDLSSNPLLLKGQWAFYWNKLLTPDSLSMAKPAYVNFPGLWSGTTLEGNVLPSKGYATYAVTVLLPHKRGPLAFKIPDVYSSYHFYVNGKIIARNGVPGTTAATTQPWWSNTINAVPGNVDTLQIVWQIANFSHYKGGANETITIGDKRKITYEQDQTVALDFLLTGCLFMGGLFFFGLYLFGRHDKTLLFFSLFCMLYSYRIVGADPYSLHAFVEGMSWWTLMRLEYISLYLSAVSFAFYIRKLYPKDTHKNVIIAIATICLLFTMVALVLPSSVFSMFVNAFLLFSFFNIGYVLFVFIKAYRNKRTGATYSLLGAVVLITVFIYIALAHLEILEAKQSLVMLGYLIFFFLQSLILSYRFAYNLKKAKSQAEKALLAKSQFLSTMSHEIRTPLNAVIGLAHLMLKNDPRKDQKEELDVMLFSANNLLSIVNDILDFNKIEAGKIHFECIETDMQQIAKNIAAGYKSYANEKGIALHIETDEMPDVTVMADPTRTSQVLTNLVHNAIKFTAQGAVTLAISVENKTEESIRLRFSVKDTGIGIAPENQQVIFDRFTQADSSTSRSFGGTGLGLSICKSILEKQGSCMQLESKEGEGSVFYFVQSFPVCKKIEKEAVAVVKTDIKNKPLHGIRILLVEDSEFNILVATRFLQAWGAEIDVAQNGRDAIDKFKEGVHKLILMDLHMPVMDGRDATIELRKQGTKVPIIALTASIYADENKKVMSCGADDIVIKPFEPESLRMKLLHHLKIAG
ncbi:ATP-binding protein [soil metagenome]